MHSHALRTHSLRVLDEGIGSAPSDVEDGGVQVVGAHLILDSVLLVHEHGLEERHALLGDAGVVSGE